jgi:hypothetical protein
MVVGEIQKEIEQTDEDNFSVYWDDFKVIEIGDGYCTPINYIQNITFQNIGGFVYESSTLTTAGNHVDPNQTLGDVIVTNTADINFQSETQVALESGFSVQPGGNFHAYIAPCNSNCPTITAYVGGEESYCSMAGQTVQLGGAGSSIATYQWSATLANGLPCNCLSNTTISDPILTIPPGAGSIKISVTANNTCDGSSTSDEQAIYYDNTPSTNPTISVSTTNITIGPSNPFPGFTITGDPHVQDVIVQLFDQNNNLINETDLFDFPLATNGTYSYFYNQQDISYAPFDPCLTYYYQITSKYICSDNASASVNINVAPPSNITITNAPNFFSPNNDGINDNYCWGVVGATSFNISVYDRAGSLVYAGAGGILNDPVCVWNGQCNNICGTEGTNGIVCNGTYFYVLDFFGCNGIVNHQHSFLELFGSCDDPFARLSNQNDTTNAPVINTPKVIPHDTVSNDPAIPKVTTAGIVSTKLGTNINTAVFPNPTTGVISIIISTSNAGKLLVNITNISGVQIMNNVFNANMGTNDFKVDLSSLEQGAYFVNIADENGVSIKNSKIMLIGQ